MTSTSYDLSVHLNAPFDTCRGLIVDALRGEGFGVLTEIDVQAVMREKIGAHMPRYVILGACNPQLAHSALMEDHDVGLLLPCNVVVREDQYGGCVVSIADPVVLARVSSSSALQAISATARQKLAHALRSVTDESVE
jgi:uncharacterized protein (DUF302 family)